MTPKEIFNVHGALYIKDAVPKELAQFLSHVLMRAAHEMKIWNIKADPQVPTALAMLHHEIMFDTLMERCWPAIENLIEEELIPTYAYARLYNNGDVLEKHSDREACEISITIQLARTHNYSWPIYMGEQRYDLNEGDAVLYKGCEISHWRNKCDGPTGYMSGQAFLHYVRKNGPNVNHAFDVLVGRPDYKEKEFPLIRYRQQLLENK